MVSKLVSTIPTRLDGEKIPGIGRIGDEAAEVRPGMPYPSVGLGEDYIETPSTTKRGFIVPVTREAIFFDRTHLILQRAAEVGEILGLNKEKRLLDLVLGATNNYSGRGRPTTPTMAAADAVPGSTCWTRNWSTGPTSTPPSSSSPTCSTPTPASRCWCGRPQCW